MQRFSRLAKNARLGDGCVQWYTKTSNANVKFMSTDLALLEHKRRMCDAEGFTYGKMGTQKSGYGGTKTIYRFDSHVNERITEVAAASIEEIIDDLDKEDLFLWFMDDGSWHKNRYTMHLYSNMLDEKQTYQLIDKIESLYGIAPRIRIDRKKDGRQFYYLYFSRPLVKLFRPEFKKYVMSINVPTMYYKFGGLDYEEKAV